MRRYLYRAITIILVIASALLTTAGAETRNIVMEPELQPFYTPEELPALKAEIYTPTLEQLEDMFGMSSRTRKYNNYSTEVISGERRLIYFPEGRFIYERNDTGDMNGLLTYDLPNANKYTGEWLFDGGREAEFMTRAEAQKLVLDFIKQCGVEEWDVEVELYYIDLDDWRKVIDDNREYMIKSVDIDNCKRVYYAIVRLSYGGVAMDDSDYMLFNNRTIFPCVIHLLIDEDGLLRARYERNYSIFEKTENKPLLGYDEAVKVLDDYYGEIYITHQINVCVADFIYCAYPLTQTQYEIVPTWKFGIRGFAKNANYVREYVRISAIDGRILE